MGFESAKNKKHALELVNELAQLDFLEIATNRYPAELKKAIDTARASKGVGVDVFIRDEGIFFEIVSYQVHKVIPTVRAPLHIDRKDWYTTYEYIGNIYSLIDQTLEVFKEASRKSQLAITARAKLTQEELEALGLK